MADMLFGGIQNNSINFKVIRLPPDVEKAQCQLMWHAKAVIDTYQEENNQSVTQFYIGKSSVPFSKSMKFDIDNPNDTWTLKRIRSRWSEHRKKYTTMVVLAVIMDDTLPKELEECKTQKYCLYLERSLIDRFKYGLFDKRIANDTSDAGKEANDHDTIAYVLYIVMKLEHPPLESYSGSSSSRRRNCGECSGCRAEDCGVCEHCLDMPKFDGPGTKKQRCKMRTCTGQLPSLSESSQQQSRESLISTKTYHNDTLESASASKRAPGSDPSETAIDKSTIYVDRELHQGNPTSSEVQKCVLETSSSENCHSGSSSVYENDGGDRKHEQKYTSKSSTKAHKAHENRHDSGGRGIGIDECTMLVDHSNKKRRHQHTPLPNSTEGTSMSRNNDAIIRSATTSNARFTSLGGHERSSEVTSYSHTMCEDGEDDKRFKWPSNSFLRSSRQVSNKHKQANSLEPEFESASREIQPHENDASMFVDDGSSIKCKKPTERHQHTRSRKDNKQAGMQNVDIERKVEAHRNAGRKRSPSSVGMQFSDAPLKKCKTDPKFASPMVAPSHTKGAKEPVPRDQQTLDRPRPNLNMFSKEDKGHTSKTVARRQTTKDHTPKVHNNADGKQSLRNRPKQQTKSSECIENIKLLGKMEKMGTEEMVKWFDALPPEKQNKVERLLKKRKPDVYSKLMARSHKHL